MLRKSLLLCGALALIGTILLILPRSPKRGILKTREISALRLEKFRLPTKMKPLPPVPRKPDHLLPTPVKESTKQEDPSLAIPPALQEGLTRRHFLLEFEEGRGPEIKSALKNRGIEVLQYAPPTTVSISAPIGVGVEGIKGARAVTALSTQQRLSPEVVELARRSDPETRLPMFIEFFKDVSREEVVSTLKALEIPVETQPKNLPNHVARVYVKAKKVEDLARRELISWVIPTNEEQMRAETVGYCPGPITDLGHMANFATRGNGWDGPGLGSAALEYYFGYATNQLDPTLQQTEVVRALQAWAQIAACTFIEAATPNRNRAIDIHFVIGDHGDPGPFDGQGGTLAHCFYPSPPVQESFAGDLHFDDDEPWSVGTPIVVDLFSVALHEIGHGLGLEHSANPDAVMYPSYRPGTILRLHQDDINGILSLYARAGTGGSGNPTAQPGAPPPRTPPASPTRVTGLSPDQVSTSSNPVALTWTADPAATRYHVIVDKSDGTAYQSFAIGTVPRNGATLTLQQPGTYAWIVCAQGPGGLGPWSDWAVFVRN